MAEYWRDLELGEEKQIGDRFMINDQWETITEAHLEIESLRTVCPATRPMQRKAECVPPVENGLNRFGLDTSYFRNAINRELNRGLADYTPDELARVLARLSVTASSQVILEREFQRRNASDTRCPCQAVKLLPVCEWHEDLGASIFVSFSRDDHGKILGEPPELYWGSGYLEDDFDESRWTHFIDGDFNFIFSDADPTNFSKKD